MQGCPRSLRASLPRTFVASQGSTQADGVNGLGPLHVWSGVVTFELRARDRRHLLRAVLYGFLEHSPLVTTALPTSAQSRFNNNSTIRVPQFPQFALMTTATTVSTTMASSIRQQFLAPVLTRLTPTWMSPGSFPRPQRQYYCIARLRLSRRSKTHFLNTHLPHAIAFIYCASGPRFAGA